MNVLLSAYKLVIANFLSTKHRNSTTRHFSIPDLKGVSTLTAVTIACIDLHGRSTMTQLWLFLVVQLIIVCFSDEIAETPPASSLDELKKLPVRNKQLQALQIICY
jgi:hypothetical protein